MGKALKPLIIALLALSVITLILGSVLFAQRDVLKTRIQRNEQAVADIAAKIRFEGFNREHLKDPNRMQVALGKVVTAAELQYDELVATKDTLEKTRTELAQTKTELRATKDELDVTKQRVAELTDTVAMKDAEIAQQSSRIGQLEQDKVNLQTQIDDLNNQLVKAEELMRDCQDEVATLKRELDAAAPTGPISIRMRGLSGRILVVNSDWNFVVLDIGSDKGLQAKAEMLVHRGDKLIGKVRVSQVAKNMAIAEILRDWEQHKLREGDHVLF